MWSRLFLHSVGTPGNSLFENVTKFWLQFYNWLSMHLFLPPANKVCESYVFTGVCLSTGGYLPPLHAGIPPWADTPWVDTPLGRHPPGQTPLLADIPRADTPLGRHAPGRPSGGTHPTGMHSSLILNCVWSSFRFLFSWVSFSWSASGTVSFYYS